MGYILVDTTLKCDVSVIFPIGFWPWAVVLSHTLDCGITDTLPLQSYSTRNTYPITTVTSAGNAVDDIGESL